MRTKIVAVVVPDDVRKLMKLASEKSHRGNIAHWVRSLIAKELNLDEIRLQERGGRRPNAGRKPSKPAVRTHRDAVISESAKIPTRNIKSAV